MGMGAAYAAGAGMGKSRDGSYMPIISALDKLNANKGKGGGGGGSGSSAATDLKEKIYEDQQSRQREIDNQYMAQHHGNLPPSAQEAAIAEAERERQLKLEMQGNTIGMEKERLTEGGRQFDVGTEQKGKQFDTTAGMAKERLGLDKNKDTREQGTYDLKMKQEKDTQDYQKMMQSYMGGDYNAVMGWFVRNAPKGADGSMRFPTIEQGSEPGQIMVTPPGSDKPEAMNIDDFGKVLWRMNPAYEFPKGAKEEADIEYTKRKGGLTADQIENRATNYAKGIAGEGGGAEYQAAYEQKKAELLSGGGMSQRPAAGAAQQPAAASPEGPGGRKPLRKGNYNGQKVIEYSDGSITDESGQELIPANTAPAESPTQAVPEGPPTMAGLAFPETPAEPSESDRQLSEISGQLKDSPIAKGLSKARDYIKKDIIEKDRPAKEDSDSDSDSDDDKKKKKKKKSDD